MKEIGQVQFYLALELSQNERQISISRHFWYVADGDSSLFIVVCNLHEHLLIVFAKRIVNIVELIFAW